MNRYPARVLAVLGAMVVFATGCGGTQCDNLAKLMEATQKNDPDNAWQLTCTLNFANTWDASTASKPCDKELNYILPVWYSTEKEGWEPDVKSASLNPGLTFPVRNYMCISKNTVTA